MTLQDSASNMFITVLMSLLYLLVSSVSAQNSCGVLDTVRNLKAQDITNTSTHLSWDPPASSECVDHYKITYCSFLNDEMHECAIKTVFLPSNTTQYVITQLKPCRNNRIQVYTVETAGKETYTELFIYTGSGSPPKVDTIELASVGGNIITIDWQLPKSYDELCYPGFQVCYSASGDTENCTYIIYKDANTMSLESLSPCTEYNISLVTVDGNFADDSKTSEKTYVSVVTAPQMPVIKMKMDNHTAHLTWLAPDALSMSCAANYSVRNCRYTKDEFETSNCNTVFSQTLPINTTETTVSDLQGCTNNHVSVSLVGHNGHSSGFEGVILDQPNETPAPSDVKIGNVTTNLIQLKYAEEQNNCVAKYRACWMTNEEDESCGFTTSHQEAYFEKLQLKACSNYTLHFTAIAESGLSSENITTTFLTGPDNVPKLTVEPSAHSALLSWQELSSAKQCGTYYDLTWNDNTITHDVMLSLNTSSYNLTDLSPCTFYSLAMYTRGTNSTTSGKSSRAFTTPLGDLAPITNLAFVYLASDTIYMTVDIADNTLHCASRFINCFYETATSRQHEQCQDLFTWKTDSFKACTNYTFDVTIITNDDRNISGSNTFNPGPKNVTNLKFVENASAKSINLSWVNPPTNVVCVEYIEVTTTRVEDNNSTYVKLPSDAVETSVTDLTPCTTYVFQVKPVASFSTHAQSSFEVRYTTACSGEGCYQMPGIIDESPQYFPHQILTVEDGSGKKYEIMIC